MQHRVLFAVVVFAGMAACLCIYRASCSRQRSTHFFTGSVHTTDMLQTKSRKLQSKVDDQDGGDVISRHSQDQHNAEAEHTYRLEVPASRYNASEFEAFYELFNGDKDFFTECMSCALVSSSGSMSSSDAGKEIDDKECVIRMNNAPTLGYERDVGSKTTYRVLSHTSAHDVSKMLQTTDGAEVKRTRFLVWGPERNMKNGGPTNMLLRSMVRTYPDIQMSTFRRSTIERADRIFEEETGRNRIKSGSFLSTGWFTMLFIKNLCRTVSVYGMIEEGHCDRVKEKLIPDVNYHYYDKTSVGQCVMYVFHENAPAAVHRFITEKRVFKKWAKQWGHVQFYHPHWTLDEG